MFVFYIIQLFILCGTFLKSLRSFGVGGHLFCRCWSCSLLRFSSVTSGVMVASGLSVFTSGVAVTSGFSVISGVTGRLRCRCSFRFYLIFLYNYPLSIRISLIIYIDKLWFAQDKRAMIFVTIVILFIIINFRIVFSMPDITFTISSA